MHMMHFYYALTGAIRGYGSWLVIVTRWWQIAQCTVYGIGSWSPMLVRFGVKSTGRLPRDRDLISMHPFKKYIDGNMLNVQMSEGDTEHC
jgi:hypothetical protein